MIIEHFALNVTDPVAMGAWYCEHLGMTLVRETGAPTYTRFIEDASGQQVELYNNPVDAYFDGAAAGPRTWHLAFLPDDIEATHARLLAAGAKAVDPITTTPVGDRLVFLRDPWGFTIQLVERADG
ncbi:MAG TPA: VOC family protein [Devosiaceae bacterium]|nr:VOC family protein [Devosiaceae bacterium]